MYAGRNVKCPLFLSHFNESWIFSTDFRKILKHQIAWKSVQQERSCSMQAGGRRDVPKLTVAFWKFSTPPNPVGVPCFFQNTANFSKGEFKKKKKNRW